jgi:GMP synthase-like glutamine amidotransferase
MLLLWLWIALMDRVKVIHGVCSGCHLMVFTIGLRLYMEFAQDATWCFSPLHRMTTNNGVLQHEVCQHLISVTGGKRDHFSAKYWKSMLSLWLFIAMIDRVKVIHGVCAGCHLIVFTTS